METLQTIGAIAGILALGICIYNLISARSNAKIKGNKIVDNKDEEYYEKFK